MAKTVAGFGGNYTSHIGSEGFQQTKELAFAIRVAEEAKMPVHIFHFKIRGKENEGTIGRYIKQIEDARARGLDITANQYPYTAMFHGWSAFFPLWMREGGPQKFAERLKDPASRARLKKDQDFITWAKEHGWWDGIVLARARTEKNKQYEGKRISQIARMRGEEDPMDTCIALMAEEGGNISGIFHTMAEADVRTVMKLPWVSIASDGSAINLDAPGVPHPRNYSTNVRVLGHYVRDEKVLDAARGRAQDDVAAGEDSRAEGSRAAARGLCGRSRDLRSRARGRDQLVRAAEVVRDGRALRARQRRGRDRQGTAHGGEAGTSDSTVAGNLSSQ